MNLDGMGRGFGGFGGFGGMGGMGGMGGGFGGMDDFGEGSSGPKDYNRAFDIDSKLYQLAAYKTSGGLLPEMSDPESILAYQNKVLHTFNHFKRKIQIGSYDYEFIERQVLAENGPFQSQGYSLDEDLNNIINDGHKKDRISKLMEIGKSKEKPDDLLDSLPMSPASLKGENKKEPESKILDALGIDESDELDDTIDKLDYDFDNRNLEGQEDDLPF